MMALEARQDQRHDLDIGEARLLINWRIWSERYTITMRIKMAIHHCESVADPRVYACSFSTFFRELIALNYCIEVKCVVNLLKVIRTATVRFHFIVCQPTNWSMLEERNVAPTEGYRNHRNFEKFIHLSSFQIVLRDLLLKFLRISKIHLSSFHRS